MTRFAIPSIALIVISLVLYLEPEQRPGASLSSGSIGVARAVKFTPAAPPGSTGITVSGIRCKAGVRQVTWSQYSPICVPVYRGNNGGVSAPGVTSKSINITYRLASSFVLNTIYSFLPKSVIGTNAEAVTTLNSYIKVFNKDFELYGRQVKLQTFQGAGNFIDELTGAGQQAAQEDAFREQQMNTFADDSLADSSPVFINNLASHGIISFTLWPPSSGWFSKSSPYAYATGLNCDRRNRGTAAIIAKKLEGNTDIFTQDPNLLGKKRSIAYIYQSTPYESPCEQTLMSSIRKDKGSPISKYSYTFDLATFFSQTSSIIARLKASGITTVVMAVDPVSPTLFMNAAAQQGYFPEWVMLPIFGNGYMNADPLGRLPNQEEMKNALAIGDADSNSFTQEAYKVFKMGCPDKNTCDPLPPFSLGIAYSTMLMLFSAIQSAGPDLTANSFESHLHLLPGGPASGMFGQWSFVNNATQPVSSFQLLKWNPKQVSPLDGLPGAFVACDNSKVYRYNVPGTVSRGQPSCPPL